MLLLGGDRAVDTIPDLSPKGSDFGMHWCNVWPGVEKRAQQGTKQRNRTENP